MKLRPPSGGCHCCQAIPSWPWSLAPSKVARYAKRLDLGRLYVGPDFLFNVANHCQQLESFTSLWSENWKNENANYFIQQRSRGLKELHLECDAGVDDLFFKNLSICQKLQSLQLEGEFLITNEGFEAILKLENLETLKISFVPNCFTHFDHAPWDYAHPWSLRNAHNLKFLCLHFSPVKEQDCTRQILTAISCFPRLLTLTLSEYLSPVVNKRSFWSELMGKQSYIKLKCPLLTEVAIYNRNDPGIPRKNPLKMWRLSHH